MRQAERSAHALPFAGVCARTYLADITRARLAATQVHTGAQNPSEDELTLKQAAEEDSHRLCTCFTGVINIAVLIPAPISSQNLDIS